MPFRPEWLAAQDPVRTWYGSPWFAPNAPKTVASTDRQNGGYLLYCTFDARAAAS